MLQVEIMFSFILSEGISFKPCKIKRPIFYKCICFFFSHWEREERYHEQREDTGWVCSCLNLISHKKHQRKHPASLCRVAGVTNQEIKYNSVFMYSTHLCLNRFIHTGDLLRHLNTFTYWAFPKASYIFHYLRNITFLLHLWFLSFYSPKSRNKPKAEPVSTVRQLTFKIRTNGKDNRLREYTSK